jgi:DNA-binding MarR family transcriptional regulator
MKARSRPAKLPECPEEMAFLELLRTTDMLSRRVSQVIKSDGLSPNQYNVLRILRGASEGLSCGEIGNRMITRDPDITRLVDRLEKQALVSRSRDGRDRRMVLIRITSRGLDLLSGLDEPVREAHRAQLGHLSKQKLKELSDLMRESRARLS